MRYLNTIVCFLLFSFPVFAHASTSGVSSGNPTKGSSVELRHSYSTDDESNSQNDRIRIRQHFEHGFTENYAIRLILTQDKQKGDPLKHSSFRVENRLQFYNQKDHGFNGALRFVYRNNDNSPDAVEVQFNGSTDLIYGLQYKQNVIFSYDIGKDSRSGMGLETRLAIEKTVSQFDIGIDMLNDFGNIRDLSGFDQQSHEIGPYLEGDITENIYYLIGLRHGLSEDAVDQSLRLFTGYKF